MLNTISELKVACKKIEIGTLILFLIPFEDENVLNNLSVNLY